MSEYARGRAREKVAHLAGQGLDLVTFWRAATEALARAVPFHLTPCFYTLDPASLLVTSHYHDGLPAIPPEWLALECLALMASVSLGPILDAEGSCLLGVRSARERADAIRGAPRLMR